MTDDTNLSQIDRWHSRPLDVHRWSDHPEIKVLTEQLYVECAINTLDKAGNRKPKKTAKDMLRVLLLDLYVAWLNDPVLALGFSKNNNSYSTDSRMDRIHIGNNIVKVEEKLVSAGYVEELDGYHDNTGKAQSYTTRIRHSQKLRDAFIKLSRVQHRSVTSGRKPGTTSLPEPPASPLAPITDGVPPFTMN